ncbi:NAD(P)H-dependent glycerol-3-phosphate dehydrogenase [Bacteroidota bacterium]
MGRLKKIAIIGNGSWATALAKILIDNKKRINWFIRKEKTIQYITDFHHNPKYLGSVEFNVKKITFYSDINQIVQESDILIFAKPSAFLEIILENLTENLSNKIVISAIKGLVPVDDLSISQYFNNKFNVSYKNLAVIAGPSHAEEIALQRLSYLTIASENKMLTRRLAHIFQNRYVRTIQSKDIIGVEYSAVLKNIYAIATGIAKGLGYGDNFQAVLVSNAQKEIKRFLLNMNHFNREDCDSVYLGDLLVTAYSQFSRNRTFGTMIGQGYCVKSVQLEMDVVAEGFFASKGIYELNKKLKLNLPIVDMVYQILYNKKSPESELKKLSNILK